jgi:hypothetical protein
MKFKVHCYNPDTKKSWCGIVARGNITPHHKRVTCNLCKKEKARAKVPSHIHEGS